DGLSRRCTFDESLGAARISVSEDEPGSYKPVSPTLSCVPGPLGQSRPAHGGVTGEASSVNEPGPVPTGHLPLMATGPTELAAGPAMRENRTPRHSTRFDPSCAIIATGYSIVTEKFPEPAGDRRSISSQRGPFDRTPPPRERAATFLFVLRS